MSLIMLWTARQKLGIGLLITLSLVSVVTWKVIERAVLVETASSFLFPGLVLGSMLVLLFTGSLIWKERSLIGLAAVFATVPSLLVAISMVHSIILVIAACIIYLGLLRIRDDMTDRIHVTARKSILSGAAAVFLGLSLLLSSQYYVHVQQLSWEQLVPSFNLAEGIGPIVLKVIAPLYPEVGALADNQVTVDNFLQDVQERQAGTLLENISASTQKLLLAEELQRTKKQLSGLLGREVIGTENMHNLLSEAIHRKTVAFFAQENTRLPVPVLPFFLSILLFLTVYPIMNFFAPLLIAGATILFRIARLLRWIEIRHEDVEQEVVAD